MSSLAHIARLPFIKTAGTLVMTILVAGCAQQQTAGYYDTPHDSTYADAQNQAQGRSVARAPSQIQLGFGQTEGKKPAAEQAQAPQAPSGQARPLSEPKTFLGTLPCLSADKGCSATRLTLTLAPGGQWRARTVLLNAPDSKNNIIEQGCWDISGTQPLRILLQLKNENTKANLTFVNDNVLRVNMINNQQPTLDYHLTRQADVDAIDELAGQPAMVCHNPS